MEPQVDSLQHLHHPLHVLDVLLSGGAVDDQVIYETAHKPPKPMPLNLRVHHPLEVNGRVLETKGHTDVLILLPSAPECGLLHVVLRHWNLVEPCLQVHFTEEPRSAQLVEDVLRVRQGIFVQRRGVVERPEVIAKSQIVPVPLLILLSCAGVLTGVLGGCGWADDAGLQHLLHLDPCEVFVPG